MNTVALLLALIAPASANVEQADEPPRVPLSPDRIFAEFAALCMRPDFDRKVMTRALKSSDLDYEREGGTPDWQRYWKSKSTGLQASWPVTGGRSKGMGTPQCVMQLGVDRHLEEAESLAMLRPYAAEVAGGPIEQVTARGTPGFTWTDRDGFMRMVGVNPFDGPRGRILFMIYWTVTREWLFDPSVRKSNAPDSGK